MNFRILPVLATFCGLTGVALAQVPPAPIPTPQPTVAPTPAPGVAPTPVQDPKKDDTPGEPGKGPAAKPTPAATPGPTPTPTPKTIEDLTKGFDKIDGLFTLYKKLDNNHFHYMAEIKQSQIGPMFMLQTTYASGNASKVVAGAPMDDLLWKFERTPDDRLILSAPNVWYRAKDPSLKVAVERDFPEAYLKVFPIMAKSDERKTVLIDFSSFFDGSIPGLNTALAGGGAGNPLAALLGGGSYALDPELSYIETLRNFPSNMVVESLFHFKGTGGGQTMADPRSLPIRVVFNLYPLPDNDYRPRVADPRIGFFINGQLSANRSGFESFDDEASADPRVYYINRWNLQKADPTAKLSPPIKPITIYLDTSIPEHYRPIMRDGILSWNKAFEAIGITGAVVVKDAPTGKDSDYDHADMRFNTVRWVASPPTSSGAYAVAQLRENPLSGEIINAAITVNANFARIAFREKDQVVNPIGPKKPTAFQADTACEMDDGYLESMVRGFAAAQAIDPRFTDQKYVDAMLRGIITHEFGHVLGLRHNFLGSTLLTPQELSNPKIVQANGISASVMDYVGFNLFGLKTGTQLFARGPGVYDRWAIEYGYKAVPGGSTDAEKPALKAIASRNGQKGLIYYGDELADDYDPSNVRYDLSSDPLAYSEKSLGVTRYLLQTLGQREPKNGESYAYFTRRLRSLIRATANDGNIISRFIGGYRVRRYVKGDKVQIEPFTTVSVADQRRALSLIQRFVFSPNAFQIPTQYLTKTAPDPLLMEDRSAGDAFPLRDEISAVRSGILNTLFDPDRLQRLANGDWKFGKDELPLTELFQTTRIGVWGNITDKTAYTALQRDLAKADLDILISLATSDSVNGDARLLAQGDLLTLKAQLPAARKNSPDTLTRLFMADALRRIDNAFKPQNGGGGGGGGMTIRLG